MSHTIREPRDRDDLIAMLAQQEPTGNPDSKNRVALLLGEFGGLLTDAQYDDHRTLWSLTESEINAIGLAEFEASPMGQLMRQTGLVKKRVWVTPREPGTKVKCSHRFDHIGEVMWVDDPEAWKGTVAESVAIADHGHFHAMEHCQRNNLTQDNAKTLPVKYPFGIRWDRVETLNPV